MALVPCSEYFLERHACGRPLPADLQQAMDRHVAFSLLEVVSRHQERDARTVTRDGQGLTLLDLPKEIGESFLSFCGFNLAHADARANSLSESWSEVPPALATHGCQNLHRLPH